MKQHREVSNRVRAAVKSVLEFDTEHFEKGLCFGYACALIEAYQSQNFKEFYEIMGETSQKPQSYLDQFFVRIAVHHAPRYFTAQLVPDKNIYQQDITTSSRMKVRGGVCTPWRYSRSYQSSSLQLALGALLEILNRTGAELSFLVDGGKHTIAMIIRKGRATLGTVCKPDQPVDYELNTPEELLFFSKQVLEYLAQEPVGEAHLVVNLIWVCCRDDYDNLIPVHLALKADPQFHHKVDKMLVMQPDKKNRKWIMSALRSQDTEMIHEMLTVEPEVKKIHETGKSLLTYCAFFGLVEAAETLLRDGINPDEKDEEGNVAMDWASFNQHINFIVLLLRYQASIPEEKEIKPSLQVAAKRPEQSTYFRRPL